MDWQQIGALGIVAAASAWLLWTQVLRRGKKTGCGACCGCAAAAPPPRALIGADEMPVLSAPPSSGSAQPDAAPDAADARH